MDTETLKETLTDEELTLLTRLTLLITFRNNKKDDDNLTYLIKKLKIKYKE